MNAHAPITDDQEAREEAARIAIIRAFEAAVTAAESFPAGRAVLGECLGITHEYVAVGTPPAIALMGDLREDARWWAECATPQELEVYGAEILRRIERTTFAENPRKRLMVALWESLTAEQQAAFIATVAVQPPKERTEGDRFAAIIAAVNPADYDLTKAEGCKDFDEALRWAVKRFCGTDERLKRHVGDMVAEWRRPILKKHRRKQSAGQ